MGVFHVCVPGSSSANCFRAGGVSFSLLSLPVVRVPCSSGLTNGRPRKHLCLSVPQPTALTTTPSFPRWMVLLTPSLLPLKKRRRMRRREEISPTFRLPPLPGPAWPWVLLCGGSCGVRRVSTTTREESRTGATRQEKLIWQMLLGDPSGREDGSPGLMSNFFDNNGPLGPLHACVSYSSLGLFVSDDVVCESMYECGGGGSAFPPIPPPRPLGHFPQLPERPSRRQWIVQRKRIYVLIFSHPIVNN